MRSTPAPPELDAAIFPYFERVAYQKGWRDGYRTALQAVTTTQDPLPLTLDGEEYDDPC